MSLRRQRQYYRYLPDGSFTYIIPGIFAVIGFWLYWAIVRGIVFAFGYLFAIGLMASLLLLLRE